MTVTTTTRLISHAADGVQTDFPYNFHILEPEHIQVSLNGSVVSSSLYDVTGAGDPQGGEIQFFVAPEAGTLVIARTVPITQLIDYVTQDPFPADTHEYGLDKLTMICQEIWSWIVGSVQKLTNKGDILTVDENGLMQAQPVGENGWIPVADSTHPYGWAWKNLGLEGEFALAQQLHFSAMDWQPDNFTQEVGVQPPSIQRHTPGIINCMRFPHPPSGQKYRAFLNRGLSIRLENIRGTSYEVLIYGSAKSEFQPNSRVSLRADLYRNKADNLNDTTPELTWSNENILGMLSDPDTLKLAAIDPNPPTPDGSEPVSFVIPANPAAPRAYEDILLSISREHRVVETVDDLDLFYAIIRPMSGNVPPPESGIIPISFSAGGWADDDESQVGIITAEKRPREKLLVMEYPNSASQRVSDGASGDRRSWVNGAQGIIWQDHRNVDYDMYLDINLESPIPANTEFKLRTDIYRYRLDTGLDLSDIEGEWYQSWTDTLTDVDFAPVASNEWLRHRVGGVLAGAGAVPRDSGFASADAYGAVAVTRLVADGTDFSEHILIYRASFEPRNA